MMPTISPAFTYVGVVDRVIDGDTVAITLTKEVDLGFGMKASLHLPTRLRLAGMDAKPLKTDLGDRAAAWLTARTGDARPLHVVTVKNAQGEDDKEKYGRYLAYLFMVDSAGASLVPSLNEAMIDVGLASPWDGRGPHPS
jgi:endonuclease YncB( thermonuclease family)